jgi:predicted metal-dependent hydrolase
MEFVRHPRAKRYLIRVKGDGSVRVTIPRSGSRRYAELFADEHRSWIERQRARIGATRDRRLEYTPEAIEELRLQAWAMLPPQLHRLAANHGLVVSRVSVRDQRSRWGSCSPSGHICLNWRLMLMPDHVREYVLIHELMHLRRLDHSRHFWRLVAHACPGYKQARQWLRENRHLLEDRV